jgi:hypothetical protein
MKTEKTNPFRFGMRQVVRHKGKPHTIIGRAEHASGEPTYLVRGIESESKTHGVARRESELVAL